MIEDWFSSKAWRPHDFQRATWEAQRERKSGLIQVPTGSGKTYAAYGGVLDRLHAPGTAGLRMLYLTPLRAMTRDLESALRQPIDDLGLPATVQSRTGDTSGSVKARQRKMLPEVLLTTPESLSLLLTYANAETLFRHLECVIVDEWHELFASKRGTQTELALARLRQWHPRLMIWGLSATIANPGRALRHLAPHVKDAVHVTAKIDRPLILESLIPKDIQTLPWAGNLGLRISGGLIEWLKPEKPTLIFTNTRNQAEVWHAEILRARPEWGELLGLHHGSLDREGREILEGGLKDGSIRLVVATASLDLGVDFSPIERIVQIGSPKGISRLLQRAGRSNHRLGETSHILCVPANVLHLLEFSAVREAIARGEIEAIQPPGEPLDVLCQHLLTRALSGGFQADALFAELRSTAAYAELSRERFDWALNLIAAGGKTLSAYPDYNRLVEDAAGLWQVRTPAFAKRHRMMIGTISADSMVSVRFQRGARLGQVEESFAARLKPGERFLFAGRLLQCHRFRDMTLFVKRASGGRATVPRWLGGRMPLSTQLASALRRSMDRVARRELAEDAELRAVTPVLEVQRRLSTIPQADEILFEICTTREGTHGCCFTFEGRLVNDGLGALLAYRMARLRPATFTITTNDYGIEWLSEDPFPFAEVFQNYPELLAEDALLEDTLQSINLGELAKRQFRGIARVAGLTFEGYPGSRKSHKQLHISSALIYDVFARFDPDNLLLQQAQSEVLESQFEETRLRATLSRLRASTFIFRETTRPTPFSLPLMADRLTSQVSTETLEDRLQRIQKQWLA